MAYSSVAETQWNYFCSMVVADWSGLWTFWDPSTGELTRSFSGVRSFKALNEEQTIIKHQNKLSGESGRPDHNGPWKIHKKDTDEHGVCHPAKPLARAVLYANGGGVWALRATGDSEMFGIELFLCRGKFRCSVIVTYNESKKLRMFGAIRETTTATTEIWSLSTELQNFLPLYAHENFIGEEKILDSSLQLSVKSECNWDGGFWLRNEEMDQSENLSFKFLPDGICLCYPEQLCSNTFSFRACILFPTHEGNKRELQEITVSYVDGHLTSVKQGLYH